MKTFKQFVTEMTIKTGKNGMAGFDPTFILDLLKKGKVIGHLDQKDIVFVKDGKSLIYAIKTGTMEDDEISSFLICHDQKILNQEYLISDVAYTVEKYRNQKDAKRIYFFLKHQESKKILDAGYQSDDGIRFIDSLAKSRFEVYWLNINTGEKEKYEPGTDDSKYRNILKPTTWRVLIEGDEPAEHKIPRWIDKSHPLGILSFPYILFPEDDENF